MGEFVKYINENLHRTMMTCGWKILIEWKEISVYWFQLKYLKKSKKIELDEYSMENDMSNEPSFI